jgi:hypothetical protein
MKKIIMITALLSVLPALATAEMKMQNSNPSPEPVAEPTLGHHMQNRDPSPEPEAEQAPAPQHTMKNTNPKKFVSSNASSLVEKHSGKNAE